MTAPEMDPRTGLLPDQAWSVPSGPRWQARLWADGRAHVIGEALASHQQYGAKYADNSHVSRQRHEWYPPRWPIPDWALGCPFWTSKRRWHADYSRAMRAAQFHNRMIVAAERQGVK